MDLNEIIAGTLGDAGGDEPESDTTEALDQEDPAEEAAAVEEPVADPAAAVVEKPKEAEPDEVAKLLDEHGVKRGKGVRENLIAYSRVRKILENQRAKLAEGHTAELTKTQQEMATLRAQVEKMNAHDELVKNNPDRYMEMLGFLHPKYKEFLRNPAAAAPAEKPKAESPLDLSDMPKADSADGYTEAGLQKLVSYLATKSKAAAEADLLPKFQAEIDKRFKPFDDAKKAREYQAEFEKQQGPKVQAQLAAARKQWGPLMDTHQEEILKVFNADKDLSFEAAIATVLLPHITPDRNKMREKILEELKAKPREATPSGGTATVAAEPNRAKTTEEIIKDSLAALR